MLTASGFVIFDTSKRNRHGQPFVWTGRGFFSVATTLAHIYQTRAHAENAIKCNKKLCGSTIGYLTTDEFNREYGEAF
ncbi:MAG: hypothetical protein KDI55_24980 [Anaerolineae bacterium]|nr:hypothetical protein [Anaerolineae bacterium]